MALVLSISHMLHQSGATVKVGRELEHLISASPKMKTSFSGCAKWSSHHHLFQLI